VQNCTTISGQVKSLKLWNLPALSLDAIRLEGGLRNQRDLGEKNRVCRQSTTQIKGDRTQKPAGQATPRDTHTTRRRTLARRVRPSVWLSENTAPSVNPREGARTQKAVRHVSRCPSYLAENLLVRLFLTWTLVGSSSIRLLCSRPTLSGPFSSTVWPFVSRETQTRRERNLDTSKRFPTSPFLGLDQSFCFQINKSLQRFNENGLVTSTSYQTMKRVALQQWQSNPQSSIRLRMQIYNSPNKGSSLSSIPFSL